MRMYTEEGLGFLTCLRKGTLMMVVVSPFKSSKTEEENVLALHDIHLEGPKCEQDLIYSDDFGIVVFCCPERTLGEVRKFCEETVRKHRQPGYIDWDGQRAEFVAADGTRSPLPPWDKTVDRLNAWVDKIHPGFKAKGFWGRSVSFVRQKDWEYKKAHGLLPERKEVPPQPLTDRESELFHAAILLAVRLDRCNPEVGMGPSPKLLAEQVASGLSFKVGEDDIRKACRGC